MPRDFSIQPLTPAELEDLQAFFCKLPTYSPGSDGGEEGYILSSDNWQLALYMEYGTYDQVCSGKEYFDKHTGGRVTFSHFQEIIKALNETVQLARVTAIKMDKNGDGFISQDEFGELLNLLTNHDKKLKRVTFADFVREADTNEDGLVSLEECAAWIGNQLQLAAQQ